MYAVFLPLAILSTIFVNIHMYATQKSCRHFPNPAQLLLHRRVTLVFLHSPTSFINSFDLPCTANPTESFVSKIKLEQQLRNIPRWRSFNSIFKPAKQYVSSKLDLSTCRAFLISFLFVLSSSLSSPLSATFYTSAFINPPFPSLIFIPCFFQPSHTFAHSTNLRGSNNLPYAQPGIYSPKRDIANFMETSRTSFTDSSFERLSLQNDAMCRKKNWLTRAQIDSPLHLQTSHGCVASPLENLPLFSDILGRGNTTLRIPSRDEIRATHR